MKIDKRAVLVLLHELGRAENAAQADSELPDSFQLEEHRELLEKYGLDPEQVVARMEASATGDEPSPPA